MKECAKSGSQEIEPDIALGDTVLWLDGDRGAVRDAIAANARQKEDQSAIERVRPRTASGWNRHRSGHDPYIGFRMTFRRMQFRKDEMAPHSQAEQVVIASPRQNGFSQGKVATGAKLRASFPPINGISSRLTHTCAARPSRSSPWPMP